LGCSAAFALYSYGRTTGVCVDSGLHTTAAVPVHEGYPLQRHATTSSVAGEALTQHLASLLEAKGYGFSTPLECDLVNHVKETQCFVRQPNEEVSLPPPDVFHLPDGQPIGIDEERYQCAEVLFDFAKLGPEYSPKSVVYTDAGDVFEPPNTPKGISWLAYAAINNCEPNLRSDLYSSIVLAGGSTLFRGTQRRAQAEVVQLYRDMHPNEAVIPISVAEVSCRQYSAWVGASMLSMITMFPHLVVTRQEYQEHGARIIHSKSL
jgi:actin-related protein